MVVDICSGAHRSCEISQIPPASHHIKKVFIPQLTFYSQNIEGIASLIEIKKRIEKMFMSGIVKIIQLQQLQGDRYRFTIEQHGTKNRVFNIDSLRRNSVAPISISNR